MYFQRLESTIVALASTKGSSIGIIRISGDESLLFIEKLTQKKKFTPFKATLSTILDNSGNSIDEAIVISFPAPHSYTGENVVELHVHGAALHAKKIVDSIVSLGALRARGGEFSYRSIINGKRNLSDVSAIDELILTDSEIALDYQRKELIHHNISKTLESLEESWFDVKALATALIDFPDDVDIEIPKERFQKLIDTTKKQIIPILENSRKLREYQGLRVVITGRPNTGKSTLFNTLLKQERAIVTEIPGTTRDFITEQLSFNKHSLTLTDTAGIRVGENSIEEEGIARAKIQTKSAHILIHLIDANIGWTDVDDEIQKEMFSDNILCLLTKQDLVKQVPQIPFPAIPLSFITGEGVDNALQTLDKMLSRLSPSGELPATTSEWQLALFDTLLSNISLFDEKSYDDIALLYYHIQNVHDTLLSLLGKNIREDIHEKIFSSFCIGK